MVGDSVIYVNRHGPKNRPWGTPKSRKKLPDVHLSIPLT